MGVGACDVAVNLWPAITVDGTPGSLDGNDCRGDDSVVPNDQIFEAVAYKGGRVYLFWIQGIVGRAYFQAFLDSVILNPVAAIDTP